MSSSSSSSHFHLVKFSGGGGGNSEGLGLDEERVMINKVWRRLRVARSRWNVRLGYSQRRGLGSRVTMLSDLRESTTSVQNTSLVWWHCIHLGTMILPQNPSPAIQRALQIHSDLQSTVIQQNDIILAHSIFRRHYRKLCQQKRRR